MTPKAPVFSKNFPPVDQVSTGMAPPEYRIEHDGHGPRELLRNSAIIRASQGAAQFELGAPTTESEISGGPGYVVRTQWVKLALSADEIVRFFLQDLNPTEFFTLARHHGIFFDISGEFYDERTGKALAPIHASDNERMKEYRVLGRRWPNGTPLAEQIAPARAELGRIEPRKAPVLSEAYPPRRQAPTGCLPGYIQFVDNRGVDTELLRDFARRAQEGEGFLHLHDTVGLSELSGKPGYRVALEYVMLVLTADEICRLVLHRLYPAEFALLAGRYGVFHEISSRFYDENTGRALIDDGLFHPESYGDPDADAPYVVIVERKGESFMHCITSLSHAQELQETFTRAGHATSLVALAPAPGVVALEPVCNVVTLYTAEDGALSAYGPFPNLQAAWVFRPKDAPIDRHPMTQVLHSHIL